MKVMRLSIFDVLWLLVLSVFLLGILLVGLIPCTIGGVL